jgi:hypothetical protein
MFPAPSQDEFMKRPLFFLALTLFSTQAMAFDLSLSAKNPSDRRLMLRCANILDLIHTGEKAACFSLDDEEGGVALREIHGFGCKGDPQTASARAFFSVQNFAGSPEIGFEAGGQAWQACVFDE